MVLAVAFFGTGAAFAGGVAEVPSPRHCKRKRISAIPSRRQHGGENPGTPRFWGQKEPGELQGPQCPPQAGQTLLAPGRFPFPLSLLALGLAQRKGGSELSLGSLPGVESGGVF